MIELRINDSTVRVSPGTSLLEAAGAAGVKVPTLCHLKELFPSGSCRMCVVEVEGRPGLVASCACPAESGLEVRTHTPQILKARRTILELLLANHPFCCLTCARNGSCELQRLAAEHRIEAIPYRAVRSPGAPRHAPDHSSPALVREPDKCILCGRCVRICEEIQGVSALDFSGRGFEAIVGPPFRLELSDTACVACGQCVLACPTGAVHEVSGLPRLLQELQSGKSVLVAQAAPALRVSLGEFCGFGPGEDVTGKVAAALRRLGFAHVFDTDFCADLAVVEEAAVLVERIRRGGPFPLLTASCPAWVTFVEHFYPDLLGNLSSCRSPQQMTGALVKTYFAGKLGVPAERLFLASFMPCTAKKLEAQRPEHAVAGRPDVDVVLTTRELARLIDLLGIDFAHLADEPFDAPLGLTTGSGDLFAVSGGVMEATLRTAHQVITGKPLPELELPTVRGAEELRTAELAIGARTLRVAVASSLGSARRLLEEIRAGRQRFDFVEVMACPGGCLGGGGQLYGFEPQKIRSRTEAIYRLERTRGIRASYESPAVADLYRDLLGEPGSARAHELLHTSYTARRTGA